MIKADGNAPDNPMFDEILANYNIASASGTAANVTLPDPGAKSLWRYHGSLTTPNCQEIVHWTVFDGGLVISASQKDKIFANFDDGNDRNNYRMLQPLYDRPVTIYKQDSPVEESEESSESSEIPMLQELISYDDKIEVAQFGDKRMCIKASGAYPGARIYAERYDVESIEYIVDTYESNGFTGFDQWVWVSKNQIALKYNQDLCLTADGGDLVLGWCEQRTIKIKMTQKVNHAKGWFKIGGRCVEVKKVRGNFKVSVGKCSYNIFGNLLN